MGTPAKEEMKIDEIDHRSDADREREETRTQIDQLRQAIEQLTSIVMNSATAGNSSLMDSYGQQGTFLNSRNPLHTLAVENEERELRRKSIIINHVRDQQPSSTISSLTTVAMPKRFESKALMRNIGFLELREFLEDYAIFETNPGAKNQTILLWHDQYMSPTTRDRVYRRLESFDHEHQTDKLLQIRYPKWTLPHESTLSTKSQEEIVSLLEIAIVPDNPREYEKALEDICKSVIDLDKVSLSPAACSYYLGKVKRVVDLIRLYSELVPESVKVGNNHEKMKYNLGTKKDPTHGTRGTMVTVNEAIMTPELRFAFADFASPPTNISTLAKHLQYIEETVNSLQKVYDKLKPWLVACQSHEQKRKSNSEKAKTADKHRSHKAEVLYDVAELVSEEQDDTAEAAETDNDHGSDDNKEQDDRGQVSAAVESAEIKATPCYAFLSGNCQAGHACARSHDKKQLERFLEEQLAMLRK